ncbi:MAG: GtrA family protein [Pseudomonadota bacterium]
MEFLRFFTVSVGGVVVDIAIAYSAAILLGLPLWIAAAIGFCVAAALNYAAHELWTFRSRTSTLSARRSVQYLAVALLTLFARLAVVALLSVLTDGTYALAILICGAGVSFFVNFLASKFVVFAHRSSADSDVP